MARDARQGYAASLQMQEEQNVVRHQAPPRQHLDGEEIGSGEHVQVPADEFLPSRRLTPLGSGATLLRRRILPTVWSEI